MVGSCMIMLQIPDIGCHLIKVCRQRACKIFELQHQDLFMGQQQHIWSSATLSGKFLFKNDGPRFGFWLGLCDF